MRIVYLKQLSLYFELFWPIFFTLNLKFDLKKNCRVNINSYLVSKSIAIGFFRVCGSFISHMAQFVISGEWAKTFLIWQAFKQYNLFRKWSTSQFVREMNVWGVILSTNFFIKQSILHITLFTKCEHTIKQTVAFSPQFPLSTLGTPGTMSLPPLFSGYQNLLGFCD